MIIEQIEVTNMAVFCYLVADEETGEGLLIDPAGEMDRIFSLVDKHGVKIKWVVNTHGHFDHTSGNKEVVERTGAGLLIHKLDAGRLDGMMSKILSKTIGGKGSPAARGFLEDGDEIKLGSITLKVIHTPGHSRGGICLYAPGNIFTGDTLFTEGYGRTDLPGGSSRELADSIRNKILTLPDDTIIWPGHNYGRFPKSTVAEQKKFYLN